jgi:uncharacterized heparinase superfamily protein
MLTVEESLWIDGDGRPHPTQQLVIVGEVSHWARNRWQFRRSS